MSRFRLLATFAALAAIATLFAACGGDTSSDDPQAVIENATLKGVKSGELDLAVTVSSSGSEGGDLDVSLSGQFQTEAGETLPRLDVEVEATGSAKGREIDFDGGLILLSDRAFVNYEGTEYEVDPTTFGFIKASLEQSRGAGNDAASPTACQEAIAELEMSELVEGLKDEGSAEVDGTETTKLSGELDPDKAIDALIELTEEPACRAQLEAAGGASPKKLEEARREVGTALKKSQVELYIGEDEIIRKLVADLTIQPKDGGEVMRVEFELTLGEVNEPQQISAPTGAKPVGLLFRKLNINPLEALDAITSGQGIDKLFDRVLDGASSGGSGSEGSGSESPGDYLDCLQNAQTPTDLQNCASLQ